MMKLMRCLFTRLVIFTGALIAVAAPVATAESPVRTAPLIDLADQFSTIADLVTQSSDFESELFKLDFDGEAIVQMVQGRVAFEPYAGTLKGSLGTLSSGAGNALDQSLLLATLLKDSGFDARIAQGRLGSTDASRLAKAAIAPPSESSISDQQGALERELKALAKRAGVEALPTPGASKPKGSLDPRIGEVSARLAQLLTLTDRSDELFEDLQDYFWVQWRLSPGEPWLDAHPAFGALEPPEALEVSRYFSDSIPEELQHRVRIEMGIERLEGGKLSRELIAAPWERPAANFFNHAITVGVMPMGQRDGDEPSSRFVPIFNGQIAPGGKIFNLLGQVIDLEAGSNAAAGVFEQVGKGFLSAAEGFADAPEDQPLMALSGQFVRVIWTRPDGRQRTEERWLLDRIVDREAADGVARLDLTIDAATIVNSLFYQRTYLAQPPGEHLAWSLRSSLESSAAKLRWTAGILGMQDWEEARLVVDPTRLPALNPHEPLLLELASVVHHPIALDAGQITWRDGPFIAALHIPMAQDPAPAWLDIHLNPWRAATITDSAVANWPNGAVIRGVLDTAWEGAVVGQSDAYFGAPAAQLEPIKAMASPAQQRDEKEGFLLVGIVPGQPQEARWWRVHPETGEVLGMREIGGAVTTEYVVGVVSLAIGSGLLVRSAYNCSTISDSSKRNCCYALAAAFGLSGGAGLVGAAMGTPLGMSAGGALLAGVTQIKAMVLIDQAQSIATDAVCD